jgi:tetraacyldisaccharide 4'-kinase
VELLAAELAAAPAAQRDGRDRLGRCDRAHQSVINVMDAARRAGLPRLTFATQTRGRLTCAVVVAHARRAARGSCCHCLFFGALTGARRALYRVGLLRAIGSSAGDRRRQPDRRRCRQDADRARARRAAAQSRLHAGVVSRGYGGAVEACCCCRRRRRRASRATSPLLRLRSRAPVPSGAIACCRARICCVRIRGRRHGQRRRPAASALARDAQVLVFDERGAGNGWLLPAGRCASPAGPSAAAHAGRYNAGAPTTPLPGGSERRLPGWSRSRTGGTASKHPRAALDALRGGPSSPQPASRARAVLRDAARTRLDDLAAAAARSPSTITLPWPADTPDVVVTEKGRDQARRAAVGRTRIWVAPLDFSFDALTSRPALLALLPLPRPR